MTEFAEYPLFERPIPEELMGKVKFGDRDRNLASRLYSTEVWTADGFGLQEHLNNLDGPTVEIGGPTRDGYWLLDDVEIPQPLFVTNIRLDGKPKIYADEIDLLCDGSNMPIPDKTVSLVLASGIPYISDDLYHQGDETSRSMSEEAQKEYLDPTNPHYNQHLKIMAEASRILVGSGLLVMTVSPHDISVAEEFDLELMQLHTRTATSQDRTEFYSAAFLKL